MYPGVLAQGERDGAVGGGAGSTGHSGEGGEQQQVFVTGEAQAGALVSRLLAGFTLCFSASLYLSSVLPSWARAWGLPPIHQPRVPGALMTPGYPRLGPCHPWFSSQPSLRCLFLPSCFLFWVWGLLPTWWVPWLAPGSAWTRGSHMPYLSKLPPYPHALLRPYKAFSLVIIEMGLYLSPSVEDSGEPPRGPLLLSCLQSLPPLTVVVQVSVAPPPPEQE